MLQPGRQHAYLKQLVVVSVEEGGTPLAGHEVDNAQGSGVVGSLQHTQGPQNIGTCLQGKGLPRLHLHQCVRE